MYQKRNNLGHKRYNLGRYSNNLAQNLENLGQKRSKLHLHLVSKLKSIILLGQKAKNLVQKM